MLEPCQNKMMGAPETKVVPDEPIPAARPKRRQPTIRMCPRCKTLQWAEVHGNGTAILNHDCAVRS